VSLSVRDTMIPFAVQRAMSEIRPPSADDAARLTGNDSTPADLAERRQQAKSRAEGEARLRERVLRERRILIPVLLLVLLAWPNFGIAKVDGRSMEPTCHNGDTLMVLKTYRFFSPVKVGDVIVIHLRHGKISGESLVKRVVFVQNASGNAPWPQRIPTPGTFIPSVDIFTRYAAGYDRVPPNEVIVMGDNYENSMDSRDFGPVMMSEIAGKVLNR
jgi:signal peptidase I